MGNSLKLESNTFFERIYKSDQLVKVAKIIIIVFVSVYLFTNFIPYFEGSDAYTFGAASLNFANGTYDITNELLQETGRWEFTPWAWTKTVFNTAVPSVSVGVPAVGAFFFSIFGYSSLFYLGPILTIIFLIISERVSTKLFGKYVGLFTLLLLASNIWILDTGVHFMSDMLFASLFLIGVFYLIKFFNKGDSNFVLYASAFLASSCFFRINGAIFFPVEIFLLVVYMIIQQTRLKNIITNSKPNHQIGIIKTFSSRKIAKVFLFLIIPWIIFFGFWFGYNDYYFGDPRLTFGTVLPDTEPEMMKKKFTVASLLTINENRFDLIKGYMRTLLPSPLSTNLYDLPNHYDHMFGKYWLGFFSIGFLISVLIFSFFTKNKRIEVFSFTLLILGTLWFFTSSPTAGERILEISGSRRYMISTFPLFFMLLGFTSQKIFQFLDNKIHSEKKIFTPLVLKTLFLISLILFFILAFYFSPPIQAMSNNEFVFQNPLKLMERYPLDLEGLSKNDIILDSKGLKTAEYGLIPFTSLLGFESPELFDSKTSIQESIKLLKETMDKGYDVYILKEPSRGLDREFFKYLVNNHGFVIKDHSKSFCKIDLQNNNNFNNEGIENQPIDSVCITATVKYFK